MRGSYQEMAAKGLIAFKELEDELQALKKTRKTTERELQALRDHRRRLGELERDKDSLLKYYEILCRDGARGIGQPHTKGAAPSLQDAEAEGDGPCG
jgi:hypothetical protein